MRNGVTRRRFASSALALPAVIGTPEIVYGKSVRRWAPGEATALCIGCARYENAPDLTFSGRDATVLAKALQALGFDAKTLLDPTPRMFARALLDHMRRGQQARLMLIFFAGHGFMHNGEVHAYLGSAPTISASASGLMVSEHVFAASLLGQPRDKILIFDACRSKAPEGFAPEVPERAKGVSGAAGFFTAFATQPGASAYDGKMQHSPFMLALLREMSGGPVSLSQMMQAVRRSVVAETRGLQIPWVRSSLLQDVCLHGPMR